MTYLREAAAVRAADWYDSKQQRCYCRYGVVYKRDEQNNVVL